MSAKARASASAKPVLDSSRMERLFEKARVLEMKQVHDFVYQLLEADSQIWYPELIRSLEKSVRALPRDPTLLWKTTAGQIGILKHHIGHLHQLIKHLDRLNKKVFDFEPLASMSDEDAVEYLHTSKSGKQIRKLKEATSQSMKSRKRKQKTKWSNL